MSSSLQFLVKLQNEMYANSICYYHFVIFPILSLSVSLAVSPFHSLSSCNLGNKGLYLITTYAL